MLEYQQELCLMLIDKASSLITTTNKKKFGFTSFIHIFLLSIFERNIIDK